MNEPEGDQQCIVVLDEPLACFGLNGFGLVDAEDWPNPCPEFQDQASCEAQVSAYGASCKWATQALYQVPADDCTPIETQQLCVFVAPAAPPSDGGECSPFGLCEASGTRVFFEDIGAGTVRLWSYEDCVPSWPRINTNGNPLDYCDFESDTPLPLICGCGCPEGGDDESSSG